MFVRQFLATKFTESKIILCCNPTNFVQSCKIVFIHIFFKTSGFLFDPARTLNLPVFLTCCTLVSMLLRMPRPIYKKLIRDHAN